MVCIKNNVAYNIWHPRAFTEIKLGGGGKIWTVNSKIWLLASTTLSILQTKLAEKNCKLIFYALHASVSDFKSVIAQSSRGRGLCTPLYVYGGLPPFPPCVRPWVHHIIEDYKLYSFILFNVNIIIGKLAIKYKNKSFRH